MKIIFLDFNNLSEGLDLSAFSDFGEMSIIDCDEQCERKDLIKEAGVIITAKCPLLKDELDFAKSLRLVCIAGDEEELVDLNYCRERGIAITIVPEAEDFCGEEKRRIMDVTYENIRDFFNGDSCNSLE